jgi:RNA polymerase sigma factor (sigma-70 family)
MHPSGDGAALAWATYDPDRGASFDTRVITKARGAILDGIIRRAPIGRVDAAKGMTRENAPPWRQPPVSIDAWEDRRARLGENAPDVSALIPAQRGPSDYERTEDRLDLERLLARLPPRQAQVLRDTFLADQTLEQVAARMGVSVTRVCQLRTQALKALRPPTP